MRAFYLVSSASRHKANVARFTLCELDHAAANQLRVFRSNPGGGEEFLCCEIVPAGTVVDEMEPIRLACMKR